MIALLWSAAALTTSVAATTPADWTTLDRDLESLSRALAADEAKGAEVTAWIKTAYRNSGDIQFSGNDEGGFQLQGARLTVKGKVGDYEFKASIDGASNGQAGDLSTKDFYARWKVGGGVHAQLGNFKSPFLFSSVASDEKEIFFDRTSQGSLWSGRELGLQLDGQHGRFGWYAALQNGGDAQGNDLLLVAKGTFAILGDAIPMKQTGGYGVDSPTRVQAGVAYLDDASSAAGDATAMAFELTAITGPLFGHLEFLDYQDGFTAGNIGAGNAKKAASADVADTSPWGVTAGYMFTEKDEAALRYEDLDDADDSTLIWAGYTRYVTGHAAKWQLNWVSLSSDAGDVDELIAGLTVAI